MVQFILLDPPALNDLYQVCGFCSGRVLHSRFREWSCVEPTNVTNGIVTVKMVLSCENYEWEWQQFSEKDGLEVITHDQYLELTHVLPVASHNCTIDKVLEVKTNWSSYHDYQANCVEAEITPIKTSNTTVPGKMTVLNHSQFSIHYVTICGMAVQLN